MNNITRSLIMLASALAVGNAHAVITLPADAANLGSDGAFAPTDANQQSCPELGTNVRCVVVDLGAAVTAGWDSAGNGSGVYDASKWAVVYKFSSINIPSNVTVKFKNHPSRAPVVWLVNGDATIAGKVWLTGENGIRQEGKLAEPGPGGFRGGYGYQNQSAIASSGFGPGGGLLLGYPGDDAANASPGQQRTPNNSAIYGNARIFPLMGGSGGTGRGDYWDNGGSGAGALLLVATGAATVTGSILATGTDGLDWAGEGSGGAIRIVADSLNGAGTLNAAGFGGSGDGRVRIETNTVTGTIATFPSTNIVAPDTPVLIWPPAAAPTVRVVSVGSTAVPTDPRASLDLAQTDITVDHNAAIAVQLQTTGVEVDAGKSTVKLRYMPKFGEAKWVDATFASGTKDLATWNVTLNNLAEGFFTFQSRAENLPVAP